MLQIEVIMGAFSAEYAENRETIVVIAKLQEGFEKRNEQFEFDRNLKIPFREDTKFVAKLLVRNLDHNDKFSHFVEHELSQIEWEHAFDEVRLTLSRATLEIRVPLNFKNFNLSKASNLNFQINENITPTRSRKFLLQKLKNPSLISEYAHFSLHPTFYLNFLLSICGDARQVFPKEYAEFENSQVVSGGRPESNRRKF